MLSSLTANMEGVDPTMTTTTTTPPAAPAAATTPVEIPKMMRCMVYGNSGTTVEERQVSVPQIRSGNKSKYLVVQVHAVGLNPVDAKRIVGDKIPHQWNGLRRIIDRYVVAGTKIGFDFAGRVVQIPESYQHDQQQPLFQIGDAVMGMMPPFTGSLAEYILVPINNVAHSPTHWTMEQAAALPLVGLTALQALQPHVTVMSNKNDNHTSISSPTTKSLLVVGASGGTGHMALQVGKCLGFSPIVAMCSARNNEFCQLYGATSTVDYTIGTTGGSGEGETALIQALIESKKTCMVTDPTSAITIAEQPVTASTSTDAPLSTVDGRFHVVLDCVTSDDPRDTAPLHYPTLLQQHSTNSDPKVYKLLHPDYTYRRLGGNMLDWFRAGVQSMTGGWYGPWTYFHSQQGREQLFWIRIYGIASELRQLCIWANQGKLRPPYIVMDNNITTSTSTTPSGIYEFNPDQVQAALDALLSRRVQGKVVIRLISNGSDTSQNNPNSQDEAIEPSNKKAD